MNTSAYRCFHSSILLSASETIRIAGIGRSTRGTIILSFDGRTHEFSNVEYVEITQSDKEIHLIRNENYDYWKKLSSKDQKKIQQIQIQYRKDKTFKTGVKTKWAKKTKSSVKISGLKKNTKYWVRIRAYKKSGNIIYVSKWITKNKKTKK